MAKWSKSEVENVVDYRRLVRKMGNYLPVVIGNPPINMFLEINTTDDGVVEYHYEVIFNGDIVGEDNSSFDDADAEQEIRSVVRELKNHINTGRSSMSL